ncbi:hypothetical protein LCL97_11310 [Seohaeicola saemankumensis]|nr:hypothetical protein [Seohaeicola saemankumensis]MCA0871416.1 hypothetical protein [Seohaeicola saemankumensis]
MKFRLAAIVPLGLAACAPLDPLPLGAESSAQAIPITHVNAAPAVEYRGYQVVEPSDWRQVNDSQREN